MAARALPAGEQGGSPLTCLWARTRVIPPCGPRHVGQAYGAEAVSTGLAGAGPGPSHPRVTGREGSDSAQLVQDEPEGVQPSDQGSPTPCRGPASSQGVQDTRQRVMPQRVWATSRATCRWPKWGLPDHRRPGQVASGLLPSSVYGTHSEVVCLSGPLLVTKPQELRGPLLALAAAAASCEPDLLTPVDAERTKPPGQR